MTIKRIILVILTIFASWMIGLDLLNSFNEPQIQSRLELYQTNLLLQATELQADPNLTQAVRSLVGENPQSAALEQYQDVRKIAEKNLVHSQKLLTGDKSLLDPVKVKQLEDTNTKLAQLMTELDLNIGILYAEQKNSSAALQSWETARQQVNTFNLPATLTATATVLTGLWGRPAQLLPDAEIIVKQNLQGWFEHRALAQLYTLQQRQDALTNLELTTQELAAQSFQNLVTIVAVPVFGCVIGAGLLLFLLGQWLIRRKQALLSPDTMPHWDTPWDGEIIWQVLILGFFAVGQLVLPIVFGLLRQTPIFSALGASESGKALLILINYLSLAAGGLGVLYISLQPFFPLPNEWFPIKLTGNWFWWGLGGYFAALPLVIIVSLMNQKIWQGRGGSNPILPIALEERNLLALFIFFVTAAIAAPIFEEILFRGFLLPSLTRYLPMWSAIVLSSVIFAIAHLSLSEVLPLTTLGMVLGFVYVRSRNLLAPMLLHGLWNAGTLVSLIILGSGQ